MSEPSSQSIAPTGGFIGQICAYFRDFLDTDFRKQRMPKRSIGMRDTKGNLTGISMPNTRSQRPTFGDNSVSSSMPAASLVSPLLVENTTAE